ncbi:hypothetical protein ACHAPI_001153 [Fusarium lateritium]
MSSDINNTISGTPSADLNRWIDEQMRNSGIVDARGYHIDNEQNFFNQESMGNSPFSPTPGSGWEESFQRLSEYTHGTGNAVEDSNQDSTPNTLALDTPNLQVVNEEPYPQEYLQQEIPQLAATHAPSYQAVPQHMQPYQQLLSQTEYGQLQFPQPEIAQPQVAQSQPAQPQVATRIHVHCTRGLVTTQVSRPDRHEEPQPRRIRIPSQLKGRGPAQEWVVDRLKEHKREYQGYVNSPEAATYWGSVFRSLSRPEGGKVTNHNNDMTFPKSHLDYQYRIRQIFEAICDWSSNRGWRAKMGPSAAKKWTEEVKAERKALNLPEISEEELVPPPELIPSVDEQWKNVIHYNLSDLEIELLSSQVLNQAILAQKGENFIPLWSNNETQWEEFFNKVLIHSALRASWISRITNSPVSETRRKDQNKAGNDRKRTLIEQGGNPKKRRRI